MPKKTPSPHTMLSLPEAPATGYMFGKGVYFADMSSKSANYCFANKQSSTGVLMLCDVALGGAYERTGAEYGAARSMSARKRSAMSTPITSCSYEPGTTTESRQTSSNFRHTSNTSK